MERKNTFYYLGIAPMDGTPKVPCIEIGCPRDAHWMLTQGMPKEPLYAWPYCADHFYYKIEEMGERRRKTERRTELVDALKTGKPLVLTVMPPDGNLTSEVVMHPPYTRTAKGYVYGKSEDGTDIFFHEEFILKAEVGE